MRRVSVHGFVDESYREGHYLLTATVVPPGQVSKLRGALRQLLPGERELHLKRDKC
jgi:hypothetical protein